MEQAPEPGRRYESYTHEAMAAEVAAGNDPAAAGQIGQQWAALGERLRESVQALGLMSDRSREAWEGIAGEAVRDTLAKAAGWSEQATEVSYALADAVGQQAGIAARARAEMPAPVPYNPVQMISEAIHGGNFLALLGLSDAMNERYEASEAARLKAIDVMNTRDAALRAAVPARSFDVPPELS
ncbi:PE-PGRS family protein [Amycolatopsis sp. K13G38]|uniref:PE-PGRS family protein n=1 Tax=Amycolatopsis acididurans TaxID=2724524 RepID=A0ABX1JIN9_9PSEU|nr:PE-PGRS family protein [Amycolatopsis acididurans]NKQ58704.1 PE-PGRS family protein [Amycolatopsis acididurans]